MNEGLFKKKLQYLQQKTNNLGSVWWILFLHAVSIPGGAHLATELHKGTAFISSLMQFSPVHSKQVHLLKLYLK